jgi:predicted DNA-binding protein YlxM (UPF0122 family)
MARKLMLKNKPGFDDYLREAYLDKEMTMAEIAEEVECTPATILNHLRRLNIETRKTGDILKNRPRREEVKEKIRKGNLGKVISLETRKKMSKAAKGRKSPNWNGGKRHRSDGYIQIYKPEHPNSCKEGYIMEHRLVMEKKLDRHLTEEEVVHHKNGIRNDNRPSNLELFKNVGEHTAFHAKQRRMSNE